MGPPQPEAAPGPGIPITWAGEATTHERLASLYAAADVTVVPSREDNMPLTAMEAQTIGCPVVSFRIGGLPDIVEHGRTGHLARPEETNDLAACLLTALDRATSAGMGEAARARAQTTWSPAVVVEQYVDLYERALT